MNKVAIAICSHPDDIEFFMAGTLLLLKQSGYQIHMMNLANGCFGSTTIPPKELIDIRYHEAKNAADLAEATYHSSIADDMHVYYEDKLIKSLANTLRKISPDIILTHSPQDYMEDHMNTSRLAVTAAFTRSMAYYPVSEKPTDKKVTIYHSQPHCNRDQLGKIVYPDIYVDISSVMGTKAEMLSCHKSQKEWLDSSQALGMYIDTMKNLSQEVGQMSKKYSFAEGWRKHLYAGYCDPEDDPLSDALKDYSFIS